MNQEYSIEKSPNDKREYRWITLPSNQLQVLLIHDPDPDKSAASLDIRVGSFADPTELPGLAHFLEHMLFLGTQKYPDENEFGEFLSQHNGMDSTQFLFFFFFFFFHFFFLYLFI